MPTFYEEIEQHIKNNNHVFLKTLIKRYGIWVKVYEIQKNRYSKVYGSQSGEVKEKNPKKLKVIVIGDDFFPSGQAFQEGWLYTTSDYIKVGQTIEIIRKDDIIRRYKIDTSDIIGTTDTVFKRWKLSALGS